MTNSGIDLSSLTRPDLTPAQILVSTLLAFALAFLWATVYRRTHTGVAYTRAYFTSLILIAPIVAMIMMAIGSNVALSLGLVGALSIIRFRTVIKDTKDMTFLFMSVSIGLCAGAGAWMVGLVGTLTVSAIAVGLMVAGHGSLGSADYILVFRSDQPEPWDKLPEATRSLVGWKQLRGATRLSGPETEYTYTIRLAQGASAEQVVNALTGDVLHDLTLITPENHLEL